MSKKNKQIISNAIKELEKEKQEEEIKKIKKIVKSYLEAIAKKEKEVKKSQEDLRALKKDLDDLKSGRLDKIEERQGKDKVHDKNCLIIIERIEKEYIPSQPWRSPWIVRPKDDWIDNPFYWGSGPTTSGIVTTTTDSSNFTTMSTGIDYQNFCGGTYDIGGNIVNL